MLAESACALDPDFPFYRLHFAELLSQRTDATTLRRARGLLTVLANSSCVAWRAFQLIKAIDERLGEAASDTAILRDRMAAASRSLIVHEHHAERLRSSFVHRMRMRSGGQFGRFVHKTAHGRRVPRLSVIVCGQAGYGCSAVLNALADQSAARGLFEVIYVECFDRIAPGLLHSADTVISCNQERFFEHRGVALNIARDFARGEVLVVLDPGVTPDRHFVERILSAFFRVPDEPVHRRTGLTRVALISGWIGRGASTPQFIAVHKADFDRIQRFDEHEIFAGDFVPALELAWRLQLLGTPVFDAGGNDVVLTTVPPWWDLAPFAERPLVMSVARLIWPRLCEESRIDPMVRFQSQEADFSGEGFKTNVRSVQPQSAIAGVEMLSQHRGYNILRAGGRMIGVRQSLSPIDPNLSNEELAKRYGPTDLIARDSLDGIINAIDLVQFEEKSFAIRSGFVRYQIRRLMTRLKPAVGRKLRRLGFRIDDPTSRAGRFKYFIKRELRM